MIMRKRDLLPSAIIAVLKMKQQVGNKRKLENAAKSIKIQEEYQEIEAGRIVRLGENPNNRYWTKGSINEANDELWKRKMQLTLNPEENKKRTTN